LEILEADAIGLDYSSLAPGAAVAGNLPYYASAPILFGLLEHTGGTGPWILMLQREVADRIRSEPGTKGYGTLTALLAPHRVVSLVSNVGPGAFHPAPKVSSAVLRFDPRPAPLFPDVDGEAYRRVVKAAFGTRRKTLRNSLRAAGFDDPEATLAAAGIDPGRRGETLAPAELADIARVLQRRLVGGSG